MNDPMNTSSNRLLKADCIPAHLREKMGNPMNVVTKRATKSPKGYVLEADLLTPEQPELF